MLSGKLISFTLIAAVFAGSLRAQIYAPAASDSFNAKYGGADKVFVFNRPTFNAPVTASIIAIANNATVDWTFQWSVYDPLSTAYKNISTPVTGKYSLIDTITRSSGYRVIMAGNSQVDTFRVWILINDLELRISNKDAADTILPGYYNCSSISLRADTTKFPSYYYQPDSAFRLYPDNVYTIRWSADRLNASLPPNKLITRVSNPTWEDTWYIITITDKYGLKRSDSVYYKSIQSKAVIKADYISLDDTAEYPLPKHYGYFYDATNTSAPGRYKFDVSGSKNMAGYRLTFGDNEEVINGKDTVVVVHEYQKPGDYWARLTTKSRTPFECTSMDSVVVSLDFANKSNFSMPNVFTPTGDISYFFGFDKNKADKTDIFRSSDISVTYIEITVFTRSGKKVHEYAGNIRDWDGWDGTIMGSGQKAPTGVYFYVITRLNYYEDKENPIDKKFLNGFIHLYRK